MLLGKGVSFNSIQKNIGCHGRRVSATVGVYEISQMGLQLWRHDLSHETLCMNVGSRKVLQEEGGGGGGGGEGGYSGGYGGGASPSSHTQRAGLALPLSFAFVIVNAHNIARISLNYPV